MVLAKEISEETRLMLALVSSVLSLVCIIPSMMLFSAGFYIQVAVQTKIRLIEGFDIAALPGCIIGVGFLCLIYNSISGALVFLSRRKKKRESLTRHLFPLVVAGLVLCLAIFTSGLMCFIQIHHLGESFKRGILHAMRKYKTDIALKEEIDILQIDYRCCGSKTYTDWFNTSWIKEDDLSGDKVQNMEVSSDNVPFSCCDPASKRPCIHQHVHSNDHHYSYDFKMATTLHKVGCRDALVTFYGHGLLTNVGAVIISIACIQIAAVLLTRIVQTSMLTALESGHVFEPAVGHIFCCENDGVDNDLAREPMMSDYDSVGGDDDYFDDSTFDDMSDEEPVYANVGDLNTFHTPGQANRTGQSVGGPGEPMHSDVYEMPMQAPCLAPTQAVPFQPSRPPSIPNFPAPAPPNMLAAAPSPRLIPSVRQL